MPYRASVHGEFQGDSRLAIGYRADGLSCGRGLFPKLEAIPMLGAIEPRRVRGMFKEFREFAIRGNVVDLAVGIIVGAAFTGIVTSLVNDVLMPPLGYVMGGVDFSNYFIDLTY